MKFFRLNIFFICYFISAAIHAQQYPQYSSYMFDQFAINPAFAGTFSTFQATGIIRNQWVGMPGAPKTNDFSVQGALRDEKTAIGLNVFSDQIGFTSTSSFMGTYAYRILMSKSVLSFGLRLGGENISYDWADIDMKDKTDMLYGTPASKFILAADAGVYYHTNSFYTGLSVTSLTNGPALFLTVGKSYELASNVVLNPSFLIKASEGTVGLDLNCNILLSNKIWLGGSFRLGYGYVFLIQYEISKKFKLGYAYDLGISDIGSAGGPTHELTLGYNFGVYGRPMQSFRYL